jgi:hypothetical protein
MRRQTPLLLEVVHILKVARRNAEMASDKMLLYLIDLAALQAEDALEAIAETDSKPVVQAATQVTLFSRSD